MSSTIIPSALPWTGERMVPFASDTATELYHWQRYLFFRPWYSDARVIDAASGEGYGTNYASLFAQSSTGIDLSSEAVDHARTRYRHATFQVADVCSADYSEADLITSFETIEHLPDPYLFLKALSACKGRIVISTPNRKTHSPGNQLDDKPLNPFHTVEWTPLEFADVINEAFRDRQVRFLSQQCEWPGRIVEGLDDDAMYCIAVIGDGELPAWPTVGLAMPTCDNPTQAKDAILYLSKFYPGDLRFSLVANGSSEATLSELRPFCEALSHIVTLTELPTNLGYGQGANRGLEWLSGQNMDLYGVVNDDVVPAVDCLNEMVHAMTQLVSAGQNPGIVGPVSNNVNGAQQVDIGQFSTVSEMHYRAEAWQREHRNSGTQAVQVRGLFVLIHPDCLKQVGGFDPCFGLGNFEDDDYNLRTRLAGFTNWIADGAFLFHHGSQTFKSLNVDYSANIARNSEIFARKWGLDSSDQWVQLDLNPTDAPLFVPLSAALMQDHPIRVNGETIDLVSQASDLEFAAWVMRQLGAQDRSRRKDVIELLSA